MYESFASFYDVLTSDIDYGAWADYISELFSRHNLSPKLLAELGCGTGNVTVQLCKKGYDVIGTDLSEEMLSVARAKLDDEGFTHTMLLRQDMTRLDLYGCVDGAVCCLDGMNYLTKTEQMQACLERVKLFLKPGGIFIFDMNSRWKFENVLDGNTFVYDEQDVYCVWQNDYNRKTKLCDFYLTFFGEQRDGSYFRTDELHRERAYSQRHMEKLIKEAGLSLLGVYGELTFDEPKEDCQRLFYVVRKEN